MTRRSADSATATCRLFTFKEGILSAVAHDLELEVGRFTITWDDGNEGGAAAGAPRVEATFEASSVRVLHAMAHDRPNPSALSDRDLRKIEDTTRNDVLRAAAHPTIRFVCDRIEGEAAGDRALHGKVTLVGRERPVVVRVRRAGDRWIAEATLHQPDFGIKPYSAMLGTLRIQPDVRVRVDVPA